MRSGSTFPILASFLLSGAALAQAAGGFSAGPGLAPSQPREVQAPPDKQPPEAKQPAATAVPDKSSGADAAEADAAKEGDFRTNVTSFKPSPRYAKVREFTTTRLWVLDPGEVTVEQWWNGAFGAPKASPGPNQGDQFFQTEVEMGVARHMQVDLYFNYEFNQSPDTGNYTWAAGGHTGVAAELRYAIGDSWGQIWGNPTLYFEVTSQYYNSPRAEFRLLLGGPVFSPKLLGALNLAFERNIFHDPGSNIDYELKATWGLNYPVVSDVFRLGVEGILGWDSHGAPGNLTLSGALNIGGQGLYPVIYAGPSMVLMEPRARLKLLGAMLFGFGDYDQPYRPTLIVSSTF